MSINIISVGKIRESYYQKGVEDYLKRLTKYDRIQHLIIPDEKISKGKSPEQIMDLEGKRILEKVPEGAILYAMAINGKQYSSEELAAEIAQQQTTNPDLYFVIGGALGLCSEVLQRANRKLSLSKMTLPHQLACLVLSEQVYRAFRIIRGEPYHK